MRSDLNDGMLRKVTNLWESLVIDLKIFLVFGGLETSITSF